MQDAPNVDQMPKLDDRTSHETWLMLVRNTFNV